MKQIVRIILITLLITYILTGQYLLWTGSIYEYSLMGDSIGLPIFFLCYTSSIVIIGFFIRMLILLTIWAWEK